MNLQNRIVLNNNKIYIDYNATTPCDPRVVNEMLPYYLPYLFFLIALFYSSVGFGGGSSYLAIMSLFITATSLLLNLPYFYDQLYFENNT